jgi:hypothetical protein
MPTARLARALYDDDVGHLHPEPAKVLPAGRSFRLSNSLIESLACCAIPIEQSCHRIDEA